VKLAITPWLRAQSLARHFDDNRSFCETGGLLSESWDLFSVASAHGVVRASTWSELPDFARAVVETLSAREAPGRP